MRWLDALARKPRSGAGETIAAQTVEAFAASPRGDYAHAGVVRAQNNIGAFFCDGLGVERNPSPSLAGSRWRRGAEPSDADGQAMLGAAYYLGAGVARDPLEAYVWLVRLSAGGSALAEQFFQVVRAMLSAKQIAQAEAHAAAPLPEPAS
jgi:TPR repeat protein